MPFCIIFLHGKMTGEAALSTESQINATRTCRVSFWALSHNWAKSFQFTTPKCESLNITRTYSSEWGSLDFTAHEVSFSFCRKENVLIIFTRCSHDVKKKKKKGWDSESHTNVLLKNWFHAKKEGRRQRFYFLFFSSLFVHLCSVRPHAPCLVSMRSVHLALD